MPFVKPTHRAARPSIGMRVAHAKQGAGEITSVIQKHGKYLCIVHHDSGGKGGHWWDSLTDDQVPAKGALGSQPMPAVA